MTLQNNSLILFQGDSITDCSRNRADDTSLGHGYAAIIASKLQTAMPQKNLRILNRGISGNRVKDLATRWQEDTLALKPDYLSILIGINDVNYAIDKNDKVENACFLHDYREILEAAVKGGVKTIIIIEPFLLPLRPNNAQRMAELTAKSKIVHCLAEEFGAIYLPLHNLFNELGQRHGYEFYCPDGVHPTEKGHELIAQQWLSALGIDA